MELIGLILTTIMFFVLGLYDRDTRMVPDWGLAGLWVLVLYFGNAHIAVMSIAIIYSFSVLAMYMEKKPGVSIGDILGAPALFALIDFKLAFLSFAIPILLSSIKKKEYSCFDWYFYGCLASVILTLFGL